MRLYNCRQGDVIMEAYERVKALRLKLGLSQKELGERLGVSRSVINNLERGVLRNNNHVLPLIKLMAREFSVSEEWLLTGKVPHLEPALPPVPDACDFLSEHGAAHEEALLMSKWLSYPPEKRRDVIYFMEQMVKVANDIMCDDVPLTGSSSCE